MNKVLTEGFVERGYDTIEGVLSGHYDYIELIFPIEDTSNGGIRYFEFVYDHNTYHFDEVPEKEFEIFKIRKNITPVKISLSNLELLIKRKNEEFYKSNSKSINNLITPDLL